MSPELPVTIKSHCSILFNETTVLILGGTQDGIDSANTYFFNFGTSDSWQVGPTMSVTRILLSCNLIPKDKDSKEMSVIAVGGEGRSTTEILDDLSGSWRPGPGHSQLTYKSVLVMHPLGGVVLVSGAFYNVLYTPTNQLYRLEHAGPLASWEIMKQHLADGRILHAAFLVPTEITKCI